MSNVLKIKCKELVNFQIKICCNCKFYKCALTDVWVLSLSFISVSRFTVFWVDKQFFFCYSPSIDLENICTTCSEGNGFYQKLFFPSEEPQICQKI